MIELKMVNKKILRILLTCVLILNFFLLPIPSSFASNECKSFQNFPGDKSGFLNVPDNPNALLVSKSSIVLNQINTSKSSTFATIGLDDSELNKVLQEQNMPFHFFYFSVDLGKTWKCSPSNVSNNMIPLRKDGDTWAVIYVVNSALSRTAITPIIKITSYFSDAAKKCSPKNFKLDGFYDGLPGWFEIKMLDSKKVEPMKSYDENFYDGTFEEYMTEADSNNAELELYKKCMIMLNLESLTGLDYEIQYSIDNFKTTYRYKKKINLFTGYSTGRGIALIPALKKGKIHKFRAIPVNSKSPTLYFSLNTKEVRKFCDLPENKFSTKCFSEKVS